MHNTYFLDWMETSCKFELHTVEIDELISIYCFKGAREYPYDSMSKKGRNREAVDCTSSLCGSWLVRNCAFSVSVSLVLCISEL